MTTKIDPAAIKQFFIGGGSISARYAYEIGFQAGAAWLLEEARKKGLHKHNSGPGGCVLLTDLETLFKEGEG